MLLSLDYEIMLSKWQYKLVILLIEFQLIILREAVASKIPLT